MGSQRLIISLGVLAGLGACSSDGNKGSTTTNGDPSTVPVVDAGNDGHPQLGDGDDNSGGDGDTGGTPTCTPSSDQNADVDMDGFTIAQGDCNDCQPTINPGAYDFPDDDWDQDCSGTKAAKGEDNCDMGLSVGSTDPKDAARAIGLCKFVGENDKGWGVIEAKFTRANGTGELPDPMTIGILPSFGAAKVPAGANMFAMSSGVARAPDQNGYTEDCDLFGYAPLLPCLGPASTDKCLCTGFLDPPGCVKQDGDMPPAGYPKESKACGDTGGGGIFNMGTGVFNDPALELTIRVPTNANSMSFQSIFYTYEYPDYICSAYNDFFTVFKTPAPAAAPDGNIVFDSNKDPIGVNTGLLAVCDPSVQQQGAKKTFKCEQGSGLLKGTGFDKNEATCGSADGGKNANGGASTGWLMTTVPVKGEKTITLRFTLWDTADATLDSTALIDKFQWSVDNPDVTETTPVL
jgi:hypothetical protein